MSGHYSNSQKAVRQLGYNAPPPLSVQQQIKNTSGSVNTGVKNTQSGTTSSTQTANTQAVTSINQSGGTASTHQTQSQIFNQVDEVVNTPSKTPAQVNKEKFNALTNTFKKYFAKARKLLNESDPKKTNADLNSARTALHKMDTYRRYGISAQASNLAKFPEKASEILEYSRSMAQSAKALFEGLSGLLASVQTVYAGKGNAPTQSEVTYTAPTTGAPTFTLPSTDTVVNNLVEAQRSGVYNQVVADVELKEKATKQMMPFVVGIGALLFYVTTRKKGRK